MTKYQQYAMSSRNDFNPVYVISLIQNNSLTKQEAIRILEEACHVIVRYENQQKQIKQWQDSTPWKERRG